MNRMIVLLSLPLIVELAWGQQGIRRCEVDGKVIYQSAPCPEGAKDKVIVDAPKPYSPPPPPPPKPRDLVKEVRPATDQETQECLRLLKIGRKFKDSESLRVEGEAIFATRESGRKEIAMSVNGKNSYGAYAGAKGVLCKYKEDGVFDSVYYEGD